MLTDPAILQQTENSSDGSFLRRLCGTIQTWTPSNATTLQGYKTIVFIYLFALILKVDF